MANTQKPTKKAKPEPKPTFNYDKNGQCKHIKADGTLCRGIAMANGYCSEHNKPKYGHGDTIPEPATIDPSLLEPTITDSKGQGKPRCQGVTKEGTQCRNVATDLGGTFCAVHSPKTSHLPHLKFKATSGAVLALLERGHSQSSAAGLCSIRPETISGWNALGREAIAAGNEDDQYAQWYTLMLESKHRAAANVEAALYREALGGNVTACIKWLSVRCPEEWGDKQRVELSGGLEVKDNSRPYEHMSEQELRDAINTILTQTAAAINA